MSAKKDKQKTAQIGSLNWKRGENTARAMLPGLKPGHHTRYGVIQRLSQR